MLLVGTYYVPLWYQSKGASASRSGIDILPFMLSVVVAAAMSGAIITVSLLFPVMWVSHFLTMVKENSSILVVPGSFTTHRICWSWSVVHNWPSYS